MQMDKDGGQVTPVTQNNSLSLLLNYAILQIKKKQREDGETDRYTDHTNN